jgi:hypothetical protein
MRGKSKCHSNHNAFWCGGDAVRRAPQWNHDEMQNATSSDESVAVAVRTEFMDKGTDAAFARCPACGAASVALPRNCEPDADDLVSCRLQASSCTECNACVTFDVSGGHAVRFADVEWSECPTCGEQLKLMDDTISWPQAVPAGTAPLKPAMRTAWCPCCKTGCLAFPKDVLQRARRDAQRGRRLPKT